jgi:hypothetical protein
MGRNAKRKADREFNPNELIRYHLDDLLFHLERDLSDGRLYACAAGLVVPDSANGDARAAIEAMLRINYQLPGHERILRLLSRYAEEAC